MKWLAIGFSHLLSYLVRLSSRLWDAVPCRSARCPRNTPFLLSGPQARQKHYEWISALLSLTLVFRSGTMVEGEMYRLLNGHGCRGGNIMEVRKLTVADAEAFWNIRLRALRDNPESFGASYEEILERGIA